MTRPRLLRPLRRWLRARVTAAYDDPTPARVTCEAFGGPCDGRQWTLPRAGAPIWLADPLGHHHLYVLQSHAAATEVVRYRYAVSAATLVP